MQMLSLSRLSHGSVTVAIRCHSCSPKPANGRLLSNSDGTGGLAECILISFLMLKLLGIPVQLRIPTEDQAATSTAKRPKDVPDKNDRKQKQRNRHRCPLPAQSQRVPEHKLEQCGDASFASRRLASRCCAWLMGWTKVCRCRSLVR